MPRRAKHWTWTLNNPTDDEEQRLADAFDAGSIIYHVYGRETGENGTPHLQGYTIFEAAIGFTTVKNRLGTARLHIEVSKGSPAQNRAYCTKDGDFEEHGQPPPDNSGRRTDLESFFEWSDRQAGILGRPVTTPEAAREHPVIITKYPRIMNVTRLRFGLEPEPDTVLRPWQEELEEHLHQAPDDRHDRERYGE